MKEETKCYCGHTTTCDCGPEETKQECMITKIMQMDAEMAYDSLPKQETLSGFEEGHKANSNWLEQNSNQTKQETVQEAAEIFVNNRFTKQICGDESYPDILASKSSIVESHILFAKWQQERSYSEEDMKLAFEAGHKKGFSGYPNTENWKELPFKEWFEQFKKK